ncbi:enoyl-CoA hydratase [Plasticicumulans lactativorans]|uniref:Enoyl-CoA hydratase n=1 Tax=Plasticicumulans lactativorans TaxID=1133106 RepID=A0A4R2L2M9_9GAMM|nr:enoyl-CoA hydratase-related protein [Plasticicumulans lactativorans]TCO80734.1 enoyl-CoA hydratase [Plasticicumulans lactativorans]
MSKLVYDRQDRIALITLNRPEALNALDDELNDELWEVWRDFAADPALDVAILTGAGRAFCAGADLKSFIPKWEHATLLDPRRNAARGLGGGITRGQHRITKPIIAAINGHAVGAGFELALACDIRIAADSASFGVFEVRQGLHQGDGGLVRLVAIAGVAVALELTLTGRAVAADEALRLGLVNRVVPAGEVLATAQSYANMILGNSQQALRSAKETVLDIIGRPLDDALRLESINGYSSVGDFAEVRERLARFFARG